MWCSKDASHLVNSPRMMLPLPLPLAKGQGMCNHCWWCRQREIIHHKYSVGPKCLVNHMHVYRSSTHSSANFLILSLYFNQRERKEGKLKRVVSVSQTNGVSHFFFPFCCCQCSQMGILSICCRSSSSSSIRWHSSFDHQSSIINHFYFIGLSY